ncbi:hypothetical protein M514_22790 [Trichuris suis]|uniref:ISXO2-like transposase domain-containing protein n=1 Tax=Trichuris suis TaxID=68888 RepID=A0A085N6H7_9BILA|nr:hypothetical protein M514_22790 [Trichuris suis]
MLPIIQRHIRPETTVITDEWRAYQCLSRKAYTHLQVNHSVNFEDRATGAHTRSVESLWAQAKRGNRRRCGARRSAFPLRLCDFTWRKRLAASDNALDAILTDIPREFSRSSESNTFTFVACLPSNHVPFRTEMSLPQDALWHLHRGGRPPSCTDRDIGLPQLQFLSRWSTPCSWRNCTAVLSCMVGNSAFCSAVLVASLDILTPVRFSRPLDIASELQTSQAPFDRHRLVASVPAMGSTMSLGEPRPPLQPEYLLFQVPMDFPWPLTSHRLPALADAKPPMLLILEKQVVH